VRLSQGAECRKDLAQRLERAGCEVNMAGTDWLSAGDFDGALTDPVSTAVTDPQARDGRDPAFLGLLRRVDALRKDLEGEQDHMVPWGIAQVYNALLEEAGDDALPRARPRGRTGREELTSAPTRASMLSSEMRAHLGQIRVQLESRE
jgi:hypothetical protein